MINVIYILFVKCYDEITMYKHVNNWESNFDGVIFLHDHMSMCT